MCFLPREFLRFARNAAALRLTSLRWAEPRRAVNFNFSIPQFILEFRRYE